MAAPADPSGQVTVLSEQEAAALSEIELEMSNDQSQLDAEVTDGSSTSETLNLDDAMVQVRHCTDLFFDNEFDEAMDIFARHERTSLPHSLGKSFLTCLYALLTLEPEDIKRSRESIKVTSALVHQRRRRTSLFSNFSSLIWRPNYDDYSDEEVHAELIYAEIQIMLTLLSFGEQGSLMSLIKGAFRMRAANNVYKVCLEILERRTLWASEQSNAEFECGVLLGIGTINLVLSHMPTRVLRLLSFAGFSGDQDLAMTSLKKVTDDLRETMRSGTGHLVVMGYLLYMTQMFGAGDLSDGQWADRLAAGLLEKYPRGAWGLLYTGRLLQMKGYPDKAIPYLEDCLKSQSKWRNVHNICYWDLLWSHAALGQWDLAAKYSKILCNQCNWSPATNMYQYACFLYAKMEDSCDLEEKEQLRQEIDQSMAKVPQLRIRYGGKTMPPEKFAITKAEKYISGERDLTYPVLELFYIWNLYSYSSESSDFLTPFLTKLEKDYDSRQSELNTNEPADKLALILLITGVCRRHTGQSDKAIECFKTILDISARIQVDNYLPPHAAFELGLTYARLGQNDLATRWLEAAKNDYSGFLIESAVHLRVHGALSAIKRKERGVNKIQQSQISQALEVSIDSKSMGL